MSAVQVTLRRVGPCAFAITDGEGHVAHLDGSAALEAEILEKAPNSASIPQTGALAPTGDRLGLRPMQLLLGSLAGCSAMDVLLIMAKGRQDIGDLVIQVEGNRVDGTPAPYDRIHLSFVGYGTFNEGQFARAVELGMTKYCSVEASLDPKIQITWDTRRESGNA